MGKGLKGLRDKVFLMTKVCTHGRDGSLALQMLEESLNRLQTDHLDLWQVHGVCFENDPALFMRPVAPLKFSSKPKSRAKFVSSVLPATRIPEFICACSKPISRFDAVQMPLNSFDANFHSFEIQVLPELIRRGIAPLGMKPMSATVNPFSKAR